MIIIFLDIDGVLNSDTYHKSVNTKVKDWRRFDPHTVKMIKTLAEDFNTKIVISSLWRFVAKKQLAHELNKSGLIKYLHTDWSTPVIEPPHRGKEIKMWLASHPAISDFLIIDDDEDILTEHNSKFIRTSMSDGFQEEHYYKAREILEQYFAS